MSEWSEWRLIPHPHFSDEVILKVKIPDTKGYWSTIKTGSYDEVEKFAQEYLADSYQKGLCKILQDYKRGEICD